MVTFAVRVRLDEQISMKLSKGGSALEDASK